MGYLFGRDKLQASAKTFALVQRGYTLRDLIDEYVRKCVSRCEKSFYKLVSEGYE